MKYAWKQRYQIMQREWMKNKCGEGSAGRGGAVLTAHLPGAFPRVSQPQAGSRPASIISAMLFLHLPSCCSLSVASLSCMSGLFAPLSLNILYPHWLFPFPSLLGEFKEKRVCVYLFAQMYNLVVQCIFMLRFTRRVQRLFTADLVRLAVFLSGKSVVM